MSKLIGMTSGSVTSRVFHLVLNQILNEHSKLSGQERRADDRIPWRASLKVQPIDQDFSNDGPAFFAISSDLSRKGLGFVYPDPMQHDYLRITLSDSNVSVLSHVMHNTSIGTDSPLYLIGVQFLGE